MDPFWCCWVHRAQTCQYLSEDGSHNLQQCCLQHLTDTADTSLYVNRPEIIYSLRPHTLHRVNEHVGGERETACGECLDSYLSSVRVHESHESLHVPSVKQNVWLMPLRTRLATSESAPPDPKSTSATDFTEVPYIYCIYLECICLGFFSFCFWWHPDSQWRVSACCLEETLLPTGYKPSIVLLLLVESYHRASRKDISHVCRDNKSQSPTNAAVWQISACRRFISIGLYVIDMGGYREDMVLKKILQK